MTARNIRTILHLLLVFCLLNIQLGNFGFNGNGIKISDFVEKYQSSGSTTEIPDFLSLNGALSSIDVSASAGEQFYKIYTNSDFLKHFEMVREDHKGFVDPFSITMKCKGIKKLLPYEGFYPAQRTVQLSQQFYESYKSHLQPSRVSLWRGGHRKLK